jgi:ABC-type ATPase with predicted acetyltransferase domain
MAAHVAWEKWRKLYVAGDDDLTLAALSQVPEAPSINSLKKVAWKESWVEQRRQYRNQLDTKVYQSAGVQKAADYVERLVDIAEIQTRHMKLAKSMQARVAASLQDMQQKSAVLSPRDAVAWLKVATDLERLAVGLVTHRTEVVATDVTALSDEELQAIINEGVSE